ncbi:hypothetical protein [Streptomyces sp. NPDC048603]|uniref:hypothetical protein n=1 Tax=Streptomyces sp. NPDC048603 TaxID=3365577 RepID=UPI003719575D
MPFHVRLRFGPPSSPAVTGTWDSDATAERKFRGFIGRYGSRADVRIQCCWRRPLLDNSSW